MPANKKGITPIEEVPDQELISHEIQCLDRCAVAKNRGMWAVIENGVPTMVTKKKIKYETSDWTKEVKVVEAIALERSELTAQDPRVSVQELYASAIEYLEWQAAAMETQRALTVQPLTKQEDSQ